MARIAGIFTSQDISSGSARLASMLEAIGIPNAAIGLVNDGGGLACSDLGNGYFSDDRLTVVLDGKIYRGTDSLEPPTGGQSDARLLAEMYRRLGIRKTLENLNGDFAFAIYDKAEDVWYVARDRFGVKPLYYVWREGLFAFGSRIRSLLTIPTVTDTPRSEYLALVLGGHYRFFDNARELSPYEEISQLPAAHFLTLKNGTVTTTEYYDMAQSRRTDISLGDAPEAYRELFEDAVAIRLNRSENPAFTLSGGLDSSSVLCTASSISGSRLNAFSTVYADRTYDESIEIGDVIKNGPYDWHRIELNEPNLFDMVDTLISHHDEPIATVTWLAHYQLCCEVQANGYDTLYGGLGGDEQHAGEYDYFFYFFADLLQNGQTDTYDHEVSMWQQHHDHPVYVKSPQVAAEKLRLLTDPNSPGKCLTDRSMLTRYRDVLSPDLYQSLDLVPVVEQRFDSYLHNHTFNEVYRQTMPCCLRASDRNSEITGIQSIFPFFDHRLFEFMVGISSTSKIENGVTKQLLRKAMKGVLPEATRTRIAKTGWNAPSHVWFSGHEGQRLKDMIHSQKFRERGIYNVPKIDRLIDEHLEIVNEGRQQENHMMFLWQLINVESWLSNLDFQSKPEALPSA
jgi:asparagine synthase (glutamine-hydrolysing)